MTTTLHDLLDQDRLSVYEAGQVIEAAGKAMQKAGGAWGILDEEAKDHLDRLVGTIKGAAKAALATDKTLDDEYEALYSALSKREKRVREATERIRVAQKDAMLAVDWKAREVVETLERYVELSERIARMPAESQAMMLRMVDAVAKREEKP
jgi:hypothetical protein